MTKAANQSNESDSDVSDTRVPTVLDNVPVKPKPLKLLLTTVSNKHGGRSWMQRTAR
jgi:hypothetical protein